MKSKVPTGVDTISGRLNAMKGPLHHISFAGRLEKKCLQKTPKKEKCNKERYKKGGSGAQGQKETLLGRSCSAHQRIHLKETSEFLFGLRCSRRGRFFDSKDPRGSTLESKYVAWKREKTQKSSKLCDESRGPQ